MWGPALGHHLVLQDWCGSSLVWLWSRQGIGNTVPCIWSHIPYIKSVCKEVLLSKGLCTSGPGSAVLQRRRRGLRWVLFLSAWSRALILLLSLHLLPKLLLQLFLLELPLVSSLALCSEGARLLACSTDGSKSCLFALVKSTSRVSWRGSLLNDLR